MSVGVLDLKSSFNCARDKIVQMSLKKCTHINLFGIRASEPAENILERWQNRQHVDEEVLIDEIDFH